MQVPVFGDPKWITQSTNQRCSECGIRTSKPIRCFYCAYVICPKCTRQETWGDAPRKVCKTCRSTGKEIEAEIKQEEKGYERKRGNL